MLILANVPEDKARAAAAEVAKGQDLASKADLVELGAQLRSEMDKGFAEMVKRFAEMDKRIDKGFAEMDKGFAEMDKRTDGRFAEMDKSLAVLRLAVFSGGSVVLALLLKLVFFP